MPRKGRSNLGYRTKDANDKRKKRQDIDYAAREREETKKRLARRREDEELREQKSLEDAEYRLSKARSCSKSKSRNNRLIFKNVNEQNLNEFLSLFWLEHGFDFNRSQEKGYVENWFHELQKNEEIEFKRGFFESIWGKRCLRHCTSHSDYCQECKNYSFALEVELQSRDSFSALSCEWSYNAKEVINNGSRCYLCQTIALPRGGNTSKDTPSCQRCQMSKEIRAKLIDYWNHRQSWQGVETKFLPHKQFECVCEKELLPAAPLKPDGEKTMLPILKSLGFEMRKCFLESGT